MQTLDEYFDWVETHDDEVDAAVEAGDADTLTRLYRSFWDELPVPGEGNQELQAFIHSAMSEFIKTGAWTAAAEWLPRFESVYPADYEGLRFARGVTWWNTGRRAEGQAELVALYDQVGERGFRLDPRYLAVVTGDEEVAPRPAEPLDVDDPRIQELASAVNEAMAADDFDTAISTCREALNLLGEQRLAQGAMWFLATIGDAYFQQQDFTRARDALVEASQAPGGLQNPFVQLRLGQSELEVGNRRAAAEGLIAAYMVAPETVRAEPDKYLDLLVDEGLVSR